MRFFAPVFLALLAASGLHSGTLVCLGDSLTAGYGLSEEEAWPALVQEKLANEGSAWVLVNAGHSGDTSAGGLRRLDWILKSRPDALLVALGANDGLRGISTVETEKNLDAILSQAKKAGVRAFLAAMELPSNYGPGHRKAFRDLYARLSKKHKADLLPFMLEGVGGVARLNQADGVHPTAEGQKRVAENVHRFLKPRLKAAASGAAAKNSKVIRSKKDLKP